jgi:hypothetical protein
VPIQKPGAGRVPAVGDRISTSYLTVGPRGFYMTPPASNAGPFLLVREVEHYPVPLDPKPDWWPTEQTPGAIVVLHSEVPYSGERLELFLRRYLVNGWHVMAEMGGPLWEPWLAAKATVDAGKQVEPIHPPT